MQTPWLQSPWLRSLGSALAGFLAYGAWAFYANMEHGTGEGLKSALVQGSFSFTITLMLNAIMEFLYGRFHRVKGGVFMTGVAACLLLYSASYSINYLAGTMNIIKTILPGAIFSTVYIVGYLKTISVIASQNKNIEA